jgi:hypothetical protein
MHSRGSIGENKGNKSFILGGNNMEQGKQIRLTSAELSQQRKNK